MSRFLRWSRCAFAILLASQAFPATSLAQERWAGGNYQAAARRPVRMAQNSHPMATAPTGNTANFEAEAASSTISDSGPQYAQYCDGGSSYCSDCYSGDCNSYDCGPSCDCNACNTGCDSCCQKCGPRCCIHADYLFLQVTDADVTHAQQQDGIGGAGTVPYGQIGTIGTDYDSGIRIGGTIACGPCSQFLASYSFFETENTGSLSPPDNSVVPGGLGAVGSLVDLPGAELTSSVGPVDVRYDVQFQVGDALFRHEFVRGCNYSLNFLVGAQVGHLAQDFSQAGNFNGGQGGPRRVDTGIAFDGGGLKAGLDVERRLCGNISLYGKFTAAAMQGRFSSRYTLQNTTTTELLGEANWQDDRIVPQFDYEAGFNWQSCTGKWHLSAGYMMSQWQNVVTTQEFIDAVQTERYTNVGDNITFAGLVARVGCCW